MDPVTASLFVAGADQASGIASQLIGGYQGRKSAKRASKYQRWNSAWAAQNLPDLQVRGLQKAGLNPMLAAGASPPAVSSASAPQIGPSSSSSFSGAFRTSTAAQVDKEVLKQQKLKTRREEMLTDWWNTDTGRNFIVPFAAASAAGVNANSVSDAVLLPSLMNSAEAATKSKHKGKPSSVWDSYKRNWQEGARTTTEFFNNPPIRRYNND